MIQIGVKSSYGFSRNNCALMEDKTYASNAFVY